MKNDFVDGFLDRGLVAFGSSGKISSVSCGMELFAPSLQHAADSFLTGSESEFRALLRFLSPNDRLQISWSVDSDCKAPLLSYFHATETAEIPEFIKRQRDERFARYGSAMEDGLLRFQRVNAFLSTRIAGSLTDEALDAASGYFESAIANFGGCLQRIGGAVRRLDDHGLFEVMHRYCNPSFRGKKQLPYDPAESLVDNCFTSQVEGIRSSDSGLFIDGRYVGFLVVKALPRMTCAGIIQQLTSLPLRNYGIVLNIEPLDERQEIETAEAAAAKLMNAARYGKQFRIHTELEAVGERIQRLARGEDAPFTVQIIIRVWDVNHEELQAKLGAVKSALSRMQSARYYSLPVPTSAVNYFRAGFPGWCWDKKTDFRLRIDDAPLANLLPISGSPFFESPEAIYDGANGNLIGVSMFAGEEGAESPQHALVVGKAGSGKSMILMDLLTQSAPGVERTVIIDNGLSYDSYVKAIDSSVKTLVIGPNGGCTLNYLDPRGAVLSSRFMNDVVTVVHEMAGHRGDFDLEADRRGAITRSLSEFLGHFASDWLGETRARYDSAARYAALLRQFGEQIQCSDLREIQIQLEAWAEANEIEAQRRFSEISPEAIQTVAYSDVVDTAYALMTPETAPQHADYQRFLELKSHHSDSEEYGVLSRSLAVWCAKGGAYGSLVDGVNNVNLDAPLVHIELGQIREERGPLSGLLRLIISTMVRNIILDGPRDIRKRVVFEELGSFLAMAGGELIVREFYEVCRKYNAVVISVIQQAHELEKCSLSLIGNMRLGIFLKQSSSKEVDTLARLFRLPDSARDAILQFPEPTKEGGAHFLCWRTRNGKPEVVHGINIVSDEMLHVTRSDGAYFEERRKQAAI